MSSPCNNSVDYSFDGQHFHLISILDMLRFSADLFVTISCTLTGLENIIQQRQGVLDSDDRNLFKEGMTSIVSPCERINLVLSAMLAARMGTSLDNLGYTYQQLSREISELRSRITDELSQGYFMLFSKDKVEFLESKQPFGTLVAEYFSIAAPDIEEASKCLGFERSTASVYHLMRVMEEGLKSLALLLGIPYAPSWESYLKQISDQIQAKHGSKSRGWKKNEPFFKELLGDLQAIKIAWRNPTMHLVRSYNQEEAEQIFGAVKVFMNRLAEYLSASKKKNVV